MQFSSTDSKSPRNKSRLITRKLGRLNIEGFSRIGQAFYQSVQESNSVTRTKDDDCRTHAEEEIGSIECCNYIAGTSIFRTGITRGKKVLSA